MKEILREGKERKWIGECEKCGCIFQCDFEDLYSIWRKDGIVKERRKLDFLINTQAASYCRCAREGCLQDVECFIAIENIEMIKSFSFNISDYASNEIFCVNVQNKNGEQK